MSAHRDSTARAPERPTVEPDQRGEGEDEEGHDHLSGPAVLLSRPGRVLLSLAVLVGAATWVESTWFTAPEPAEEVVAAATPTKLSSKVQKALDESGIEDEGESSSGGAPLSHTRDSEGRGLVNLFKKVAGPPLPPDEGEPSGGEGEPAAAEGEPTEDDDGGVQRIETFDGEPMGHFRRALRKTDKKEEGAVTRVIHFGDSTIVADLITGTARRKLQERFGDAGHGFVLVGKPWDWYAHQNITHYGADAWRLNRITFNPMKDGRHGLGGVSSRAWGPGPWAIYENADEGPTGRRFSSLTLLYHEQPRGGEVAVLVDGEEKATVNTKAEAPADGAKTVRFSDGPHKVKVQSKGGGEVRLYGVVLEREVPGVVYDSIGISGIRAKTMGRFDAAHFKGQLKTRDPDLVIVNLGTNESEFEGMSMEEYEEDYGRLIGRIRSAVPEASCLVASPPDRAKRNSRGRLATTPMIPKIIAVQRKVAEDKGCAFWNTYEAMGGENSMVAWFRHKPRLGSGDYTHFTVAGGEALGVLLYEALIDSYEGKQ